MRTILMALTGILTVGIATAADAAPRLTDAQCHAIARERGSSEAAGTREHNRFIAQCMVGKVAVGGGAVTVPITVGGPQTQTVREERYDRCHELAQQRGSGETAGRRNHEHFITLCMAGKVN
jgi:hypothetical protein